MDLKKDLLKKIFSLLGRPGHPTRQAVDARPMVAIQSLERVDIAGLAESDQLSIINNGRSAHPY